MLFVAENEKKLLLSDEKHREQVSALQTSLDEAHNRLRRQEERLTETNAALSAAGRLTEQLDIKETVINNLRKQRKLAFSHNAVFARLPAVLCNRRRAGRPPAAHSLESVCM